jgi:predicted O-methyltransferase YrrM
VNTLWEVFKYLKLDPIGGVESPIDLVDFTRANLADLFNKLGFGLGVEVGVALGSYSEVLCTKNPDCKIWGIDPWESQRNRQLAARCLAPHKNYVMLKKTSMEALESFEDSSLDFVYIDGDHRYKYVKEDIEGWARKVRVGGIVSGHDYIGSLSPRIIIEVKPAVHEYVAEHKIHPWFTLGRLRSSLSIYRDRTRSWFWVKEA